MLRSLAVAAALVLAVSLAACSDPASEHKKEVAKAEKDLADKRGWKTLEVTATAYTARPQETKKNNPDIAAWGDKLVPGMKAIAVSRDLLAMGLTHNTPVHIDGLPGVYKVKDKMNKRWRKKIDIFYGQNVQGAMDWGKRNVTIHWPAPGVGDGS
jgi:3D (Asp-Asp-Asp) domain-containing protein